MADLRADSKADLLLELFSEEIPARMQEKAAAHLRESLVDALRKAGFDDGRTSFQPKAYVTPRRLAVSLAGLPIASESTETELRGPKVGAPEAALKGFLKKTGLSKDRLIERDGVYFAVMRKEGQQTADMLKTIIEDILASFPWPKSMRWGNGEQSWVRPLHYILCIFDEKIVPVEFAGIKAGNSTHGHRFLSPDELKINSPTEYEPELKKAFVIADRDARKAEILKQAQAAAKAAGLVLKQDEALLEEVTGLVEYPTVLVGSIDKQFMDLPGEVLVSEMRAHQKYFALEKQDGSLADTFLITSNMVTTDDGRAIIAGNERVLRARLADGRFFWDQDRKKPLSEWAQGLKTITYHAEIGSIADKVESITRRALQLAKMVEPNLRPEDVERAARLCKADLVTGMVGEFPELQGIMGRYYALQQKEKAAVSDAIRDHYLPLGPHTDVPTAPLSICIALADKLDTLIAMFAIGEKPTGSKDPFALRRAALGVIRILLDNTLRLSLKDVLVAPPAGQIALHKAHKKLEAKTEASLHGPLKAHKVGKYLTINESSAEDIETLIPADLTQQLFDFFIDRLKVQLKDSGIRHDVIHAVVDNGDDDLVRIVKRARAVQDFLATEDGINLLIAYKRAANIRNAGTPAAASTLPDFDRDILVEKEEKHLASLLEMHQETLTAMLKKEEFASAMTLLATFRKPVDVFFEEIMVNCEDETLRAARLGLLAKVQDRMDSIANFALIEGDLKEHKKKAA